MMSRIYSKIGIVLFAVLILTACKSYFPVQENFGLIKVNQDFAADSTILIYYRPFQDSLNSIMKVPLVELADDLSKKLPESTLGNFMVDILKTKAADYSKQKIDAAILNYGGIRVSSLTKGFLNVEHAYLLMPFDNYIVLQILNGQQLQDFCDSIAMKKGWPVSGISFQIKNQKAIQLKIGNEPVDLTKNYTIALNDYLANGGDGITFLKYLPQQQTGVLFRDAIIEYWKETNLANKKVTSSIENRIIYAE